MTLRARVEAYVDATEQFLNAARAVSDDQLDRRIEGGWSARQIIHHVADSETQSYARLRRLIAEAPGSLIQGYDEAAWAANDVLGYEVLPVAGSLAVIAAVRASSGALLARIDDDDLSRAGTHTESGAYTLDDWLTIYTAHPIDHLAQLREAVNA